MIKKILLTYLLLTLFPSASNADEFWRFVNFSCNENVPFFSARTIEYWNPDYEGMAKDDFLKTSQELENNPYLCIISDKVSIKVTGRCSSYGKSCAPGRGPSSEEIFIYVNGRPLLSRDPLSSDNNDGAISYTGSPFSSLIQYVEISVKAHNAYDTVNAVHCEEHLTNGKQDRRYRDRGHEEVTYENVETRCARLKYYCDKEKCLTTRPDGER